MLRTSLLGGGCLAACPAGQYRNGGGGGACTASDLAALQQTRRELTQRASFGPGENSGQFICLGQANVLELCLLASFLSWGLLLPFSQKVFGS